MSEHLKKSNDTAHDYVLKHVNNSIQEIKSMEEKIYLSLFEDFFELLPAITQKCLLILGMQMKTKEL